MDPSISTVCDDVAEAYFDTQVSPDSSKPPSYRGFVKFCVEVGFQRILDSSANSPHMTHDRLYTALYMKHLCMYESKQTSITYDRKKAMSPCVVEASR